MEAKKTYKRKAEVSATPSEYGKLPPQAIELEESVLGALMLEKDAFGLVGEFLKPETFYKDQHGMIYKAIMDLSMQDKPIDMHTVTEQLKTNGDLENVGGPYAIAMLTMKVASSAHIEFHAKIVAQKHIARELIKISSKIQNSAFSESEDVDKTLQEAEGMIFDLSQQRVKKDFSHVNPVIEEARNRMFEAVKYAGGLSGVASGFTELDRITSGWQRSDLVIIAARPAMGKTAFVLSMAKNMAVDMNIPVAVFSLEMANVQLVNRLISNVCQISGGKIKSGLLEPYELELFDSKITNLIDSPIYLDDTGSLSVMEFRTKARRLVREHHVKIIIIDYLQLMNASGMSYYSREQEVSIISRSLKALAKELDIPIIALSQLNRNVESRGGSGKDGKKPQLSDLRESGAIEQDADMVCFIHRPEYYGIFEEDGKDMRGLAQLIIAKHRNGAVDTVDLKFVGQFAQFKNETDEVGPYEIIPSKQNNSLSGVKVEINSGNTSSIPDYVLPSPSSDSPF